MALKGNRRHLKRLAKSRMVPIPKKGALWLVKPQAGAHKALESVPLQVFLRDMMGVAETAKEAKRLISRGEVLVDGKVRRDADYGVGLMDIVALPKIRKFYQFFTVGGKLRAAELEEAEAKLKSCRIVNKTLIRGNKVQLNLHDGKNILIEKEEDRFKVGDTVRVTVPEYKVESFLKLERGANCYIFRGKHSGELGVLEEVVEQPGGQPSDAKLKANSHELITRKDYLFAVSKDFHL